MNRNLYPSVQHRRAAEKVVEILSKDDRVMSILLACSCARGKASKDSCLDMCAIVRNRNDIKGIGEKFQRYCKTLKEFKELRKVGKYSNLELDITDGRFKPTKRDWVSGPDSYELLIGNTFVYTSVLFDRNNYFFRLRSKYIPYYSEKLRKKRLGEVKRFMFNNLDHIPLYVKRELYFQSFARLYSASKEFLQALFIKNKKYPIAYDKWIKEQLVEILRKPEVYRQFVRLYEIKNLESNELVEKSNSLRLLAKRYL